MSGNDKKKSKKTMWIVLIILVVVVIFYLYKQKNENMTYDIKQCDVTQNYYSCFAENLTGVQKNNIKIFILNGNRNRQIPHFKNYTYWSDNKNRPNPELLYTFFKEDFNNKINASNLGDHNLIIYQHHYIVDGDIRHIYTLFYTTKSKITYSLWNSGRIIVLYLNKNYLGNVIDNTNNFNLFVILSNDKYINRNISVTKDDKLIIPTSKGEKRFNLKLI